jgi:CheY-like chemotaxis protein
MIVEDEIMLQDVYRLIIESEGHRVITANNGLEALQKIKITTPDVVLLDMLMPVMSGKEFMLNLDLEALPPIKIIVYSNLSDKTVEAEMVQLGASDFVIKSSMTPRDLIRLIQTSTT